MRVACNNVAEVDVNQGSCYVGNAPSQYSCCLRIEALGAQLDLHPIKVFLTHNRGIEIGTGWLKPATALPRISEFILAIPLRDRGPLTAITRVSIGSGLPLGMSHKKVAQRNTSCVA